MTFFEKSFANNHGETDSVLTVGIAVADPKRKPEKAGPCGIQGCGCPALVRGYDDYCLTCAHSASEHW
jgi:hypothetical protein